MKARAARPSSPTSETLETSSGSHPSTYSRNALWIHDGRRRSFTSTEFIVCKPPSKSRRRPSRIRKPSRPRSKQPPFSTQKATRRKRYAGYSALPNQRATRATTFAPSRSLEPRPISTVRSGRRRSRANPPPPLSRARRRADCRSLRSAKLRARPRRTSPKLPSRCRNARSQSELPRRPSRNLRARAHRHRAPGPLPRRLRARAVWSPALPAPRASLRGRARSERNHLYRASAAGRAAQRPVRFRNVPNRGRAGVWARTSTAK